MKVAREILLSIHDELCQVCPVCEAARSCTVRAIVHMDPDESPYLDIRRCYDCRVCVPACPHGAIVLAKLS